MIAALSGIDGHYVVGVAVALVYVAVLIGAPLGRPGLRAEWREALRREEGT